MEYGLWYKDKNDDKIYGEMTAILCDNGMAVLKNEYDEIFHVLRNNLVEINKKNSSI